MVESMETYVREHQHHSKLDSDPKRYEGTLHIHYPILHRTLAYCYLTVSPQSVNESNVENRERPDSQTEECHCEKGG